MAPNQDPLGCYLSTSRTPSESPSSPFNNLPTPSPEDSNECSLFVHNQELIWSKEPKDNSIQASTFQNQATKPVSQPPLRHHCPSPVCSSHFGRPSDRDRHFITKHGQLVKYFCPFGGCSRAQRGVGRRWKGYSRQDKVAEHMRKAHGAMGMKGRTWANGQRMRRG